jgi:iron complex transport system substrate-binding protein
MFLKNKLLFIFLLLGFWQLPLEASVRVTDFSSRVIELEKPAQRVVAIGPHIVENVFSVGAGNLLVGVIEHSDFPEPALQIPRVGDVQGLSIERITALNPDLILLWRSAYSVDVANKLIELGFTVYLDEPKSLKDLSKSLTDLSLLLGKLKQGTKAIKHYEEKLGELRHRYQQRKTLRVFYQIWSQPLQTINDSHIISDIVELCGGENVFADAKFVAPKVSVESLLKRDPEVIIGTGRGPEPPAWIMAWGKWEAISAVKNKQIYFIHPDLIHRHSVRILQGATNMCEFIDKARNS